MTLRWPSARPERVQNTNDCAFESWEPLVTIADHAGVEWGELARKAAVERGGVNSSAT